MKTYKVTVDDDDATCWYDENDELHRNDGPAVEYPDGYKAWYQHGERHRNDGPAVEEADGSKHWYQHGKFHRDNGPAIEYADGSKAWFRHGKHHRDDGPAIERADGLKYWWLNGEKLTEAEFFKRTQPSTKDGCEVIIEGKTYILKLKE